MKGLISLALIISMSLCTFAAQRVVLMDKVMVREPVLKLSHIFLGELPAPDTIIANAPEPGQKLILYKKQLETLAAQNNLELSLMQGDQVVIERAATILGFSEIEPFLKKQLTEHVDQEVTISLDALNWQVKIPQSDDYQWHFKSFDYLKEQKKFKGIVEISLKNQVVAQSYISGKVTPLVEVPALSRIIDKGEVIGDHDIIHIKIPENKLASQHITDTSFLIGKTPSSRPLKPNTPLDINEVKAPLLIRKGQLVTVKFMMPGLQLTNKAIAKSDGYAGQTIALETPAKKTIQGTAISATEVEIKGAVL